ncbi:carbamate kinase [Oceanispirochaeta crateris]|uniref:Carbamate kinase n=1 Tax=Oceanispirochaeta crateris TaxID=2518645 RepID=A0A5C1QKJ1_9SPIO|nr:carbamate kinase [Oceanispirochaeta crateris]QEN07987.1 carbamate kinase [Oceanispirochaeta crateris]
MAESLALIAIGGNSLIADKDHMSVEDQYAAVCTTARHIADLVEAGMTIVVTHGNGPQVGFILRRSEIARETAQMHPVPLVNCDADTQGAIGYQIQQALDNEFRKRKIKQSAATIVTQVLVDKKDEAFLKPAKPIGQFYTADEAHLLRAAYPEWTLVEDAGRGFRRVVASPLPQEIIELGAIKALISNKYCVVAAGGGGIPVVENSEGQLEGIDAVIDKDFASAFLSHALDADVFIISTGVKEVCLNFGKPDQMILTNIKASEARQYLKEGHFAPGSMAPKIKAALDFLERGGREVIITSPDNLKEAVLKGAGTHITQD